MTASFFPDLLTSIADRGRAVLARARNTELAEPDIGALCRALVSRRGEASGVAPAAEIFARWDAMTGDERLQLLLALTEEFDADIARLNRAIDAWRTKPEPSALLELHAAAEPRRQEVIRRLNIAPGGTARLV